MNAPGSTTVLPDASSSERSSEPSLNVTWRDWPGWSVTRSKPRSALTGRVTEATVSRTYSCTTSSPARRPTLRTVALTLTDPSAAIDPGVTARSLSANLVYERP